MNSIKLEDQQRLSDIRSKLLQFEAEGQDVSTWEATLFFDIIEKQRQEINKLRKLCS